MLIFGIYVWGFLVTYFAAYVAQELPSEALPKFIHSQFFWVSVFWFITVPSGILAKQFRAGLGPFQN